MVKKVSRNETGIRDIPNLLVCTPPKSGTTNWQKFLWQLKFLNEQGILVDADDKKYINFTNLYQLRSLKNRKFANHKTHCQSHWLDFYVETKNKFKKFGPHDPVEINNFAKADADDSVRVAVTRHPFTRIRSAWRDKSRKFMFDNHTVNVELFRRMGLKGVFSRFFENGRDPYGPEANETFWGHAVTCEKSFGQYSKELIQIT